MRLLSRQQVAEVLDLDELVEVVAQGMLDLSSGSASMPPRIFAEVPADIGLLTAMPAYLPSAGILAAKLLTLFPGNGNRGLDTHQAVIVVFDAMGGKPLALMDGAYITAARTAAASALATRYLARDDAKVLTIVGTGVQARSHVRAFAREREWREIRLVGRAAAKAHATADDLSAELSLPIRAMTGFHDALAEADVVCAATDAPAPVVRREWLSSGVHINSIGLNRQGPEVDAATVREARVVVESRALALAAWPVGLLELVVPHEQGLITAEHIHAELGELVSGTRAGRETAEEITLYKSAGVAVQDAAAAALVLRAAEQRNVGMEFVL